MTKKLNKFQRRARNKFVIVITIFVVIAIILFNLRSKEISNLPISNMFFGTHCYVGSNPNDRNNSCVVRVISDCNNFLSNANNLGFVCDNLCSIKYSSLITDRPADSLFWNVKCTK